MSCMLSWVDNPITYKPKKECDTMTKPVGITVAKDAAFISEQLARLLMLDGNATVEGIAEAISACEAMGKGLSSLRLSRVPDSRNRL